MSTLSRVGFALNFICTTVVNDLIVYRKIENKKANLILKTYKNIFGLTIIDNIINNYCGKISSIGAFAKIALLYCKNTSA